MDREILKELLIEHDSRKIKQDIIPREILGKIKTKKPFVIIISGIRRCGKSTLLDELRAKLDGYYVDFDDERLVNFTVNDFQTMYELLVELFGEKDIFFFDEIQNIQSWERFVRRLHDEGKKIYITGSNASMLSKELGTHLTGRNLVYSLYPFSFKEFLKFKNHKYTNLDKLTSKERSILKRLFNEYLQKGGFPEYLKTNEKDYLKNVYENILYRDIITRYNLQSQKALKEVVYFVVSNIGKEISFNVLRKLTNLTSATTIREYFEYMENSYLAFLIPRYDVSLKKQIYYNKKVYFIDAGMTKILGFRTSRDIGRILENIVFLQLKRQNKEIFFHKDKYECDFVIRQGIKITEAIQVTYDFQRNKEREINGLLEALRKYKLKKGLILTMDEEKEFTQENKKIIIKSLWKYLLEE